MQHAFINGFKSLAHTPDVNIMGLRMRPFSIGHSILLEAVESPFMLDGDISLDDLSLAVWLCSMTFEDGMRELSEDSPRMQKAFRKWGRKWGKHGVFSVEFEAFSAYLNYYCDAPSRWDTGEKNTMRVPWQWSLVNTLSGSRADQPLMSEILNMPLNVATCQASAIGAANGDESLMTEYEEKAIAELKQLAAAGAANG